MTREECIALLYRYAEYDGIGIPNLAGCKEAMKMAADLLSQPSLPSDLDEGRKRWKEVSESDYPKPDKDKLYCVHIKQPYQHYLLATVILHPNDDGLCQWRCTEFPHHRYDMCEGDKYLEINPAKA